MSYLSYKRVVLTVFLGDQSVEITKVFHLIFEEANLRVRVVFKFLWELGVEVRPRQASVLACVVLAGIREGLVSPRSSVLV